MHRGRLKMGMEKMVPFGPLIRGVEEVVSGTEAEQVNGRK